MKLPTMILAAGAMLAGMSARAEGPVDSAFEKDRQAILGMAGEFKVDFHFQETLSLHPGYKVTEKPYDEEAFETVKIAEDSGRRILLQHVLQVDGHVVKHWSHLWIYEDREILEFRGHRTWGTRMLSEAEAKGTWTQRVTEVTDEPRYEGVGRWVHHEGSSEWTSSVSNRPLPRREYTKRSDYDLLVVKNRHTVTPDGWFHEQDNVKWVQRDGQDYPLCREVGFNRYERVKDQDFTEANAYWQKTATFWNTLRKVWETSLTGVSQVTLKDEVNGQSFSKVIDAFKSRVSKGEAVTEDEIRAAVTPFLIITPKAAQP